MSAKEETNQEEFRRLAAGGGVEQTLAVRPGVSDGFLTHLIVDLVKVLGLPGESVGWDCGGYG